MYSTWGKNSIIFMFDIAIILFKSCKQSLFQVITHNNVGYATITARIAGTEILIRFPNSRQEMVNLICFTL